MGSIQTKVLHCFHSYIVLGSASTILDPHKNVEEMHCASCAGYFKESSIKVFRIIVKVAKKTNFSTIVKRVTIQFRCRKFDGDKIRKFY